MFEVVRRQQTKQNLYVSVETYLSPVETHCINIEYFLPDVDNQTKGFSEDAMTRLRKFPLLLIHNYIS